MTQIRPDRIGPIFSKAQRREVILLVLIKLAALFVIYRIFFAPFEVPPLSPDTLAHHLLGP